MPFKTLKDVAKFKVYVERLREGLDAAASAPQALHLVDSFVSDSQTCPLLLVGEVPKSLITELRDGGSQVFDGGSCVCVGTDLKWTGSPKFTDREIKSALKSARIVLGVEKVGELPALGTPQGDAARPASAQVEAAASKAQAQAPALIARMDAVIERFLPGDTQKAAFEKLRDMLRDADKADNVDRVQSLLDRLKVATDSAAQHVEAVRDAKKAHLAALSVALKQYEVLARAAFAEDEALLAADLARIDTLEARLAFTDATASLKKMLRRLVDVKVRTAKLREEQVTAAVADAAELMPKITAEETQGLEAARATWAAVPATDALAAFQAAEQAFDKAVEMLMVPRKKEAEAQSVRDAVDRLWSDMSWRIANQNLTSRVNGYLNAVAGNTAASRIKTGRETYQRILDELQTLKNKDAKALADASKYSALLNQDQMEVEAAIGFGDARFSGGLVGTVWSAVKTARKENPPNGGVGGTYSLADVEAALVRWKVPANGILSNFHMPGQGGGRPQAKWEKDYTRPVVEANFCVKWRGQKVNIHVNVEPRSFVDKYGDDLDWSEVPQSVREGLGRAA